jgi:hypothetical protein
MTVSIDLSTNPLFEVIKPQREDQRQFLVMLGYVRAATEQTVTVYPDLDLRMYLEIPRSQIIWAEQAVPGQQSSPTKLVINSAAEVKRFTTSGVNVEVGFLSGLISSACLPTSVGGVSVNVLVDEKLKFGPQCIRGTNPGASGGSGVPKTNLYQTGVCIDDGTLQRS